jgi:hypothetical protein
LDITNGRVILDPNVQFWKDTNESLLEKALRHNPDFWKR